MKTLLIGMMVALLLVGCGEEPGGDGPKGKVNMEGTAPNEDALETAVDWSKLQDRNGVTYLPNTDKPFSGYAKRVIEGYGTVVMLTRFKDGYVVRFTSFDGDGDPKWAVSYMDGKVSLSSLPDLYQLMSSGLYPWWDENYDRGINDVMEQRRDFGSPHDGLATVWHSERSNYLRQKAGEIHYMNGKLDGAWTQWYGNGQKSYEGSYKDDKRDGLETSWYENGQKKSERNYKDGKEDGLSTSWYENGQKQGELNFKDGNLVTVNTRKPNGEKCPVTNVKDGNGVWVWYHSDGTEGGRRTFKDGQIVED